MWLPLCLCCSCFSLVSCWSSAAGFQQIPLSSRKGSPSSSSRALQHAEPRRQQQQLQPPPDNAESKVEKLGQYFKRNVRKLRERSASLDLVFLVDESSSVGPANFLSELRFVKKLLSDFPVVPSATRVAIVTFSSKSHVLARVDYISTSQPQQHKCSLLNREIPAISYKGGGTYTKGAFQQAAQILQHSRGNSTKVIFLITDGYSNGGDPRPIATSLRDLGVEIFTFGIWQGNIRELHDMASHPKEEHCYLLHSFAEFEALARRALHEDLPSGGYIQEDISHCFYLCEAGEDCCDVMASCKCGTHTGQFECICEKGYYGKGLQHECTACPSGTYKPEGSPGGISTCIRCPDENHSSPPGSDSIEDCVCKEGYRAIGSVCQVVHCPELQAPENGYFIQNICNNHFEAACGIRCKLGFDLVGSSIRLCQPNGLWSGSEAICKARICPKLHSPKHGHINCSASSASYKTECYVTCDEGYLLEGNAKLTCQGNSKWDGKEPHCEEIHCPVIQKPENLLISPSNCGQEPARSGTLCQLSCDPGFILYGTTKELRCLLSGKWSENVQKAFCEDIEPPIISCPDDIHVQTLEHQNAANIYWDLPIPKDNSGDEVSLQVSPAFIPPHLFPIGEVAVKYTAMDKSGNLASCKFNIKVIDVESPVIDRCRSPPPIQTSENEFNVTWEEPQFSDNSGHSLIIRNTHSPGDLFPQGETKVHYTATDPSGNNRTCELHIIIKGSPCEIPFKTVNGDFVCSKDKVGINCTLQCKAGYSYPEGSTENYYCVYEEGVWKPPHSTDWPDCSLNRFANHGYKSFEMLYKATRCDDTNFLKNFADTFQSTLGKMVPSFCNDVDDVDCRLEDLPHKQCLEYNYDYENGFAIGPGGWGVANRLDYSYDDFLDVIQEDQRQKHISSYPKSASLRVKRHKKFNMPMTDQKIKLIFNITASVPLPDERNDTLEIENQRRLIKTLETITNRLKRTLKKEPMYSFQFASELVVADSNSLESEKAFLFCRPGSVLKDRMCVNCPLGTYYSLEHLTCESCWIGSYQDEEGHVECKSCPAGAYTEYLHSRSFSECKAQCKPGTYSSNGLETCESCAFTTYQPAFGAKNCIACPKSMTTVRRGAVNLTECGVPCPNGEFSRSGLMPCYPCPRDYYQPDRGKSYCLSCPFYGTTTIVGARSITDCSSFGSSFSAAEEGVRIPVAPENIKQHYEVSSQVFHECFLNPCHNSGTCKQIGSGYICICTPGYKGSKCEVDINECKSIICQNSGVCKDGIGKFTCHCQPGYTGQLCEEDINECSSNPCLNKGNCVDGVNSYNCICSNGFIGTHCETESNECLSNPCLNHGICEDQKGGFQCLCPAGFTGSICEKNIDECHSTPCKNGAKCIDGIDSYRCHCTTGYTGVNCEINFNECESNPCLNQATCVDALDSYICKCTPGFTGRRCETEQSSGFNLDFEVSGIYGYVLLENVLPSLSAISCTFWMRSSDTTNYGTPISYAVENGNDNAFLLTDYNGWVLYVNGKERITDCPSVNDGKWHHIAVTWTSTDGAWRVYIDGKLSDGGTGLSVGSNIPGGGVLVLAQDQDQRGEGFNPAESFVGSISQLNIWNHTLSAVEVKSLATSCPEELKKGNVLAWPDFLAGVVGRVKIDSKSIFCSDCPNLEDSIPHLHSSATDLKPGSKLSLFCDPGFQIVGSFIQQCLNLGQWSQPLPRCERISCGVPPPLDNGFYSAEDFYAGSTVTYQCNNGYYLLGNSRMFCIDSGNWSETAPSCLDVDECAVGSDCDEHASCHNNNGSYVCTCIPPYTGDGKSCAEPIKCKRPEEPEYGHVSGDTYIVGSKVTFSCEEGYQLMGDAKIICLESGEWSHIRPYCQAVSCHSVSPPNNGAIEGTNFTFGKNVTYRCNEGYQLTGNTEALCLASGIWSQAPPSCELVECPAPEGLSNGNYTMTGTTYLSTISYTCNDGYSLQGPSTLTCEASARWSGGAPVCDLVFCGSPPEVKDAVIIGNNFTFGNRVTYMCKERYTLIGPETLDCLASGKWNGSTPQCLAVSCDEPPSVEHASPESGHRLFGDIAIYYCTDGYSLADNHQMLCNVQGKWVPPEGQEMPLCIADFCEKPKAVSYSILESLDKAKFAVGTVVSFKCMEGFVLNTSAKIECTRGGQWNPSPLTIKCIPVRCGEPPVIRNGYVSGTNYSFDAVVAYSCNKGYYIKGEKKRTCEATGEWSGRMPTCHPVSCGEPPQIENGFFELKTGTVFENEVTYHCKPGYKLIGSSVRVCQANRQWYSESPPSCVLLSCGKPPSIQHGYSKGEIFEVDSKIEFFCDEGYELIGDTSWTCQKTGIWSKIQTPACMPAKCPEPPLLENQLVLRETTDIGIIYFSCREGYVLHGSFVLKCLISQQWNDSFPLCRLVVCQIPPYIPFGDSSFSSLQFGSIVKYSCVDGFLLRGNSELVCLADGSWSSPLPECIPVECPQPEEIQNGIVDVQGLTYLSTALYTCKPGFELIGNSTIFCEEDGHWLGGTPVCKPIECLKSKEISNGKFSYLNLHYGQTITYTCDRGFRLKGKHILTCLKTGEWDADVPFCETITCDPPHPIENGFVEGADYSYGAMIIYSCMPGFQLSGLAMQTCKDSGWSGSSPVCLSIDCGLPPHIDFGQYMKIRNDKSDIEQMDTKEESYNAPNFHLSSSLVSSNKKETDTPPLKDLYVELSDFLFGTLVLYTCYTGYEKIGNSVLVCQEDGSWNGSAPVCESIECDIPTTPNNGFINFTDNALSSTVQYGCNPGYELIGSDSSLCLSNRQWTNKVPYCEIISCDIPHQLANGLVEATNYTYLSVVHYECNPGYQLNGSSKRTCQDDKKWDGNEPICVPISCGQPTAPKNGQVSGDGYTFQKHVNYSCNEGFLLDGDRTAICLANGRWRGVTPICTPIKCVLPVNITNGEVIGSGYDFGKQVEYHCNEGYLLHGLPKLTCQADGTWDAEVPYCEPVNCGPPEDISHAFLNGSDFSFGEYIQYVCFPGYELHGTPLHQCLSSGLWSGIPPLCLPCTCPIPVIQNGMFIGKDFRCGEVVKFQCDEGFKLLGPPEIKCEAAGKWNSGFPHCGRISCGTPPSIPNAFINGSSSLDENAIVYNCVTGYVMRGSSELVCTKNGTWSEPYPDCELVSCGPPSSVLNAVAFGDSHTYGSKVQFRCLKGYVMNSEEDTHTCLKDGFWSSESISCVSRKCSLPTNTVNIIVSDTDFTINKTITISCTEGYVISGTSTSTCQPDGSWAPPFSDDFCSPISCGKPEALQHGILLGTRYLYKDTILYQCNAGYELQGESEQTCQHNKLWSGKKPECRRISCGTPEFLENGIIQGSQYLFGDEIFYSCNQGFELRGPSRRICHVNKQWSPAAPVCVKTTCEAPVLQGDGKAIYENLTVGSKVVYSCSKGFSLEGEPLAECAENGSWNYPIPLCKPNPCPVPLIIPENAVLTETEFYVGQNVSVKCQKGFRLQGLALMTCNPDQTWTPTSAKCEKVSCGPPHHIENGIIRGTFHQFGDIVTYSCYSGYMLEGSIRSVCLYNQTWSQPPVCRAVCRFPCQNGGVCQRPNACSCPEGWMGRLCEEPICILPCLNGGRCIGPYECSCPAGWTGSRCHTAVCQSPCLNGGKCIRPNRCHCPSTWTGPDCSRRRRPGFYPF